MSTTQRSLKNYSSFFCAPINSNVKTSDLRQLSTLHKKAIRDLCKANYNAHSAGLYRDKELLNNLNLNIVSKASIIHDYHYCRLPDSFCGMLKYRTNTGANRLRHHDGTFDIPKSNFLSPLYGAALVWNSLPYSLCNVRKTGQLKKELRTYLLDKYETSCDKPNCYTC